MKRKAAAKKKPFKLNKLQIRMLEEEGLIPDKTRMKRDVLRAQVDRLVVDLTTQRKELDKLAGQMADVRALCLEQHDELTGMRVRLRKREEKWK